MNIWHSSRIILVHIWELAWMWWIKKALSGVSLSIPFFFSFFLSLPRTHLVSWSPFCPPLNHVTLSVTLSQATTDLSTEWAPGKVNEWLFPPSGSARSTAMKGLPDSLWKGTRWLRAQLTAQTEITLFFSCSFIFLMCSTSTATQQPGLGSACVCLSQRCGLHT